MGRPIQMIIKQTDKSIALMDSYQRDGMISRIKRKLQHDI